MNEPILAAALWLAHERGLSVIALDSPADSRETDPHRIGKVPRINWAPYQRVRPSDDNLTAWFSRRPRNVGFVTGAISGLVAVDLDNDDALAWARAHLPPTDMRTRTPRGEHWFYRHPGVPIPNRARIRVAGTALALDVRGDGGYVVAPPSLHASGAHYERLGSWPPVSELPIFNPAWLAIDDTSPATPVTNGARAGTEDRAHLLRRARRYVEQVPPAIEGQGGDTHTFRIAATLVRDFGLDDSDALDVLGEWNRQCVPPWTDEELATKIRSAHKYGREPIGALAATPPPRRPTREPSAPGASGSPAIAPFACTDLGNAEAFVAWHGDEWRFDHQQEIWRHWEAPIWAPDDDGLVVRTMTEAMRRRYHEAARLPERADRAQAAKWAITSESRHRIDASLYLAARLTPIATAGNRWDADPYLLACPNGVINLRTGEMRAGEPADGLTLQTSAPFDPNAPCPRFDRFMLEVTNYDGALVAYLQRAIGSSITGDTGDQVWHLLIGPGSGGKSTLLRVVGSVLGSYSYVAPFSTFIRDPRGGTITNDLAALRGRRFVAASEVREHARLDEGRVKSLTGGDPVTARHLFREYFSFVPVLHLWLAANHEPIVGDDSRGFWRRVRLVPLTQQFPTCGTLGAELTAEAPGILAWLVRGALDWQAHGLTPPPAVRAATGEYEESSDPLADFLGAACLIDPAESIRAIDFYRLYTRWAEGAGLSARELLTSTAFGRLVAARFAKSRTIDGALYSGVGARMTG